MSMIRLLSSKIFNIQKHYVQQKNVAGIVDLVKQFGFKVSKKSVKFRNYLKNFDGLKCANNCMSKKSEYLTTMCEQVYVRILTSIVSVVQKQDGIEKKQYYYVKFEDLVLSADFTFYFHGLISIFSTQSIESQKW